MYGLRTCFFCISPLVASTSTIGKLSWCGLPEQFWGSGCTLSFVEAAAPNSVPQRLYEIHIIFLLLYALGGFPSPSMMHIEYVVSSIVPVHRISEHGNPRLLADIRMRGSCQTTFGQLQVNLSILVQILLLLYFICRLWYLAEVSCTSLYYSKDFHQLSRHTITFTMLSIFNPFRSAAPRPPDVIPLDPVKTHEVETTRSDSARTLKHLLKLNHAKHAILYSHDRFHNHLPSCTCPAPTSFSLRKLGKLIS